MTTIILMRAWQQTKKLNKACLHLRFSYSCSFCHRDVLLHTKLNFSPQCLVHLRLFNQHRDAVWIRYSFHAEKKVTLELSGTWATHKFLALPENSTDQLQGVVVLFLQILMKGCCLVVIELQICQKKDSLSLLSNTTGWLGKCKDTERNIHQGVDAISWKQNMPNLWHWVIRSCLILLSWFWAPYPEWAMFLL